MSPPGVANPEIARRFPDLRPPLAAQEAAVEAEPLSLLLRRSLHRGLPHAHRRSGLHQKNRLG